MRRVVSWVWTCVCVCVCVWGPVRVGDLLGGPVDLLGGGGGGGDLLEDLLGVSGGLVGGIWLGMNLIFSLWGDLFEISAPIFFPAAWGCGLRGCSPAQSPLQPTGAAAAGCEAARPPIPPCSRRVGRLRAAWPLARPSHWLAAASLSLQDNLQGVAEGWPAAVAPQLLHGRH